jgi:hypothetical protein
MKKLLTLVSVMKKISRKLREKETEEILQLKNISNAVKYLHDQSQKAGEYKLASLLERAVEYCNCVLAGKSVGSYDPDIFNLLCFMRGFLKLNETQRSMFFDFIEKQEKPMLNS